MEERILVVDDEETICSELCDALRDNGFEAVGVGTAEAALEEARRRAFDVCLSDIRLPGLDGVELLKRLGDSSPETAVILITAYGEVRTAIEALRSGAADYVLKPFLIADILNKIERLVEHRRLGREVRALRSALCERRMGLGLVGDSPAMGRVYGLIDKVGGTRSNLLITGPTGTGKELVALAVHEKGIKPDSPFVPINCAAIPENLLESELFGYVKGAFTGATANKDGLLRAAGEGTVFLDELGEMPLAVQAKLLRVLETREVQPLGSVRRVPIHARVVAATHRDLEEEVAAGRFREDLYYRLAVIEIELPPLSERRTDIPLLVRHFIEKYNPRLRRQITGVSNEALHLLVGYRFKGNIRELENAIERAMILCEGDQITPVDLPDAIRAADPLDPAACLELQPAVRHFETTHVRWVLELCGGNKERAAKKLGMSLSSLYRKLGDAHGAPARA